MKRLILCLAIVLMLAVAGHAQAETITGTGNIFPVFSDDQKGATIDYWNFTVGTEGIVQIDILSTEEDYLSGPYDYVDVNSDGEIAFIDSYIHLFNDDGSLDASDLIASNDESSLGGGDGSLNDLDSYLSVLLEEGNYTLAVGDYDFTLASAVAGGINPDSGGPYTVERLTMDHGDYQIQFTGDNIEITSDPGTDVLPPIAATTTGSIFSVFDDQNDFIGSTIDYWSFTVNTAGIVQIDTLSVEQDYFTEDYVDLNGDGEIAFIDPYIYLFNDYPGSIDASDLIASNDDTDFYDYVLGSGDGSVDVLDSYLSVVLEEGNYTLAVGDYDFTLASAVAGGINPDSFGPLTTDWVLHDHGDYQLQFAGDITITGTPSEPIPEPTTMLLLGSGLIGLAGFRRKMKNRRQ